MRTILLLLLAAILAPPAATAHSHKKKGMEIVHPWTPEMHDAHITNIPVYMRLKNAGRSAERLLSAETPLAEKAELIEVRSAGTIKLPTPVPALHIPATGTLELEADGARILLSGFKKRLNAYDSFELTLVFEKAGRMVVEVAVEETAAPQPHKH
jgi:copper(I)-binding protein